MKRKIALLFAVIMILSCMPVMAKTAGETAGASNGKATAQAVKSGWTKVGSDWRFYTNGVAKKSGIFLIKKQLFGFDKNGNLQKGFFKVNDKTYYGSTQFGPSNMSQIKYGIVLTGYRKVKNDYYYFHPEKRGRMVTGFVRIDNKLYYFKDDGKQYRKKGWIFVGNVMYYVTSDGTIATNTTVDGIKIGPTGAVTDLYGMDKKAQGYSSDTRYMLLVNKTNHLVNIYEGSRGSWKNIRRGIPCTIGKSSSPTRSGTFRLSIRSTRAYGYKDFKGSTAFYATRITSGNFFHSILYKLGSRDPNTAKVKDGTLGKNLSNSCIRLPLQDARYIWHYMPRYSATVIY